MKNSLGNQCPQLNVTEDLTARHQGLLEILVHCWVTLVLSPHCDLLHPLTAMLQDPEAMMVGNSFGWDRVTISSGVGGVIELRVGNGA